MERKDEQESTINESNNNNNNNVSSINSTVAINSAAVDLVSQNDPDFDAAKAKKLRLLEAVRIFNENLKQVGKKKFLKKNFFINIFQGIKFILSKGVIESGDEEKNLAKFFKNTEGLDKVKIGEYLGEK